MKNLTDGTIARTLLAGPNTFREYDNNKWWAMRPVDDVIAELGITTEELRKRIDAFYDREDGPVTVWIERWKGVPCTYVNLLNRDMDTMCRLLNGGKLPPIGLPAHLAR